MEDLPEMIEKQYSSTNHSEECALKDVMDSKDSQVVDDNSTVDEYRLPPMFIERKFINSYSESKQSREPVVAANKDEHEQFIAANKTLSLKKNSAINIEVLEDTISLDRLNDYMLNPAYVRLAVLNDEQLIRAMGGTLRHAASSIFVTSFTTAAAFLTNYITKLPYVQLFGVFTGTCIIVYFTMVITMIAAFVILYEKHIQLWRCKLKPNFTDKLEAFFDSFMEKVSLLNYRIINKNLPKLLIKYRFVWFTVFLVFGIAGMVAVFYKPQLKPPANWKYQFFQEGIFDSI